MSRRYDNPPTRQRPPSSPPYGTPEHMRAARSHPSGHDDRRGSPQPDACRYGSTPSNDPYRSSYQPSRARDNSPHNASRRPLSPHRSARGTGGYGLDRGRISYGDRDRDTMRLPQRSQRSPRGPRMEYTSGPNSPTRSYGAPPSPVNRHRRPTPPGYSPDRESASYIKRRLEPTHRFENNYGMPPDSLADLEPLSNRRAAPFPADRARPASSPRDRYETLPDRVPGPRASRRDRHDWLMDEMDRKIESSDNPWGLLQPSAPRRRDSSVDSWWDPPKDFWSDRD